MTGTVALGTAALAGVVAWQVWFTPEPVPDQLEYLPAGGQMELVELQPPIPAPKPDKDGVTLFDFSGETVGGQPQIFVPAVGNWVIGVEKENRLLVIDGRSWERGQAATGIAERARSLYGERYAEFLDNVQAFAYFPYAVASGIEDFRDGEITLRFKSISGRIDQAAGILFNLKRNGDYLTVRANPLENNLVLWGFKRGKRSSVKWIRQVRTPKHTWHELKVVISGRTVKGYLNGKHHLTHRLDEPVSGRVGIWSKADSVVYIDDFKVSPDAASN